jgi:acyl-CoA synthetase (AMP-forming)/AMP-acid ligase II
MNTPDEVQTVTEALGYWAAVTPKAIALLAPGRQPVTYRALHAAVARLATELRALGLGRDDGIALLFPEGPELCLALLAAMSVGIAIPLAWPRPDAEYEHILALRHVKAILASNAIPASVRASANSGLPVITFVPSQGGRIGDYHIDGRPLGEPSAKSPPHAEDTALILHSSGTTSRPKLIPRLHRNIMANCRAVLRSRAASSADRCLSLSRETYSQGFNVLMFTIFSGASLIRAPALEVDALPQWIRTYAPTYISTTPAVVRLLGEAGPQLREAFRRSSLTRIHSSAGLLLSAELDWLEESLGVPVLNGYGMSEASGIAGEPYPRVLRVPGSVGPPWCEMAILGATGQVLKSPETGEIVVRGPTVFPGYLDDPEANAAAFLPGGWFRTGDLGYRDDHGYLHLTGRIGEIINRGGEKIVPREVDEVICAHPSVAAAAVFAVPDARLGQDAVAAVVRRPETSAKARELRAWMLDHLTPYKVPRRIWFVDRLPRTPTGKVQRGELAQRWREHHG